MSRGEAKVEMVVALQPGAADLAGVLQQDALQVGLQAHLIGRAAARDRQPAERPQLGRQEARPLGESRAQLPRRLGGPGMRLQLGFLNPALRAGAPEEVVWGWGALAGAAPAVGWVGALALSTWCFALRHTRSEDLVAYLVLGASFGGVFLATGRLVAAIAAHAGYNPLVLTAASRVHLSRS